MVASSPTPSEAGRWGSRRSVVVGNTGCKRVALFQEALQRHGLPPAQLVTWESLARREVDLREVVLPGELLRLESPGRHWETERLLLERGAEEADEDGEYARLSRSAVRALAMDKGLLLPLRQWYLGFRSVLRQVAAQIAELPGAVLMNDPAEVSVMFDKPACHARLGEAGVAVPPALGPVSGFEELRERMRQRGWRRVFLKPAHGSSGAGVVAYQTDGTRHQAVTPVEMVQGAGELRLYNSRRMRTYRDTAEVAALVDTLCCHRLHVEQWLPKASLKGGAFDLRVVVIQGRACHRVVRVSRSPITNLHLLNQRGDMEAARERVGEAAWKAALAMAERAMAAFPGSLHGGVDVMLTAGRHRPAVLEVNAFGDLLPGLLHDGMDTYSAELEPLLAPAGVDRVAA